MVFEPTLDNEYSYHDNSLSSFKTSNPFWSPWFSPIHDGDSGLFSSCSYNSDTAITTTGPVIDSDVNTNIELQYEAEISSLCYMSFSSSFLYSSNSSINTVSSQLNPLTQSLSILDTPFTTPFKHERHSNDSDFPSYSVGHAIGGNTAFHDVCSITTVEDIPKHIAYSHNQYTVPQTEKDLPETPQKITRLPGIAPDPQYVCSEPEYGKRFQAEVHRTRHEATVHGDVRFECSCCQKQFNRPDNLRTHIKTHLTYSGNNETRRLFNNDGTYNYKSIALYGFEKILQDMQANEMRKAAAATGTGKRRVGVSKKASSREGRRKLCFSRKKR